MERVGKFCHRDARCNDTSGPIGKHEQLSPRTGCASRLSQATTRIGYDRPITLSLIRPPFPLWNCRRNSYLPLLPYFRQPPFSELPTQPLSRCPWVGVVSGASTYRPRSGLTWRRRALVAVHAEVRGLSPQSAMALLRRGGSERGFGFKYWILLCRTWGFPQEFFSLVWIVILG